MVCTLHVYCGQISGQLYILYDIYVFHMSVWYKSKHTIVFTPTYVESHTFNVHRYVQSIQCISTCSLKNIAVILLVCK